MINSISFSSYSEDGQPFFPLLPISVAPSTVHDGCDIVESCGEMKSFKNDTHGGCGEYGGVRSRMGDGHCYFRRFQATL